MAAPEEAEPMTAVVMTPTAASAKEPPAAMAAAAPMAAVMMPATAKVAVGLAVAMAAAVPVTASAMAAVQAAVLVSVEITAVVMTKASVAELAGPVHLAGKAAPENSE